MGRALLQQVVDAARTLPDLAQIELKVASTNAAARTLYEVAGFRQVAILPRALRVDAAFIDEAVMILELAGALA